MVHRWNAATLAARLLLLAAGVLLINACTPGGSKALKSYNAREKALVLIDKGKAREKEGALLLALEEYNRAALLYECPEAWYRMGQVFEAQGKTEAAATAYNKAIALAPDYQEARLSILALGYKPQNYTPTADDLARAKEWSAQRGMEIAQIRSRQTDVETTTTAPDIKGARMEVIESAAQKRLPTSQEVAAVLFAPETAEEKLPSAVKPVYANEQDIILATYPYHYQKAQQLRKRQLYDRAAEEYDRAIQADPKQLDARIELGDMLIRLGRSDAARARYERAVQDFPDSPQPLFKMGRYYAEVSQPDRAREYYKKALEKDPKYVEALNNIGVLDMVEKKYPDAAKTFDQIIQIDSNYANAYLNRGIIASDIETNRDLAVRCFKRYLELNGTRSADVRKWIEEIQNEGK